MTDKFDLGHGVTASFTVRGEGTDERNFGLMHWHPVNAELHPELSQSDVGNGPGVCVGHMMFDGGPDPKNMAKIKELFGSDTPSWQVIDETIEHLTLSPSSLCRRCGHHGFVTDGKWVPA